MMALSAGSLVLIEFDAFRSRLPGFYQFFNFYNGLWLMATLGIIKIFHEFGHGLSCKHFGGECHEMGVMILVLTPCLYCNVSDSWMLPNKWHRAAIGAAGIIVEVSLASIATFLWWSLRAGDVLVQLVPEHHVRLSVSTILFNGNPLLRYDGYYILADVMEIPNLRQKATSILSRKLGQLCLGLEPPDDPFLPQRNQILFAFYSVAAATYRWFVLASICWFLFQVFKPYGLEILGKVIVGMSVYGLIVVPLWKVGKFFYVPGRIEKVKKPRMYISLAVLFVAGCGDPVRALAAQRDVPAGSQGPRRPVGPRRRTPGRPIDRDPRPPRPAGRQGPETGHACQRPGRPGDCSTDRRRGSVRGGVLS